MSENKSEMEDLTNKAYSRVVEIVTGNEYNDNASKMGAMKAVIDNLELSASFIE